MNVRSRLATLFSQREARKPASRVKISAKHGVNLTIGQIRPYTQLHAARSRWGLRPLRQDGRFLSHFVIIIFLGPLFQSFTPVMDLMIPYYVPFLYDVP